ncbi:hypothetical protein PCASD_11715 [Puccinia coronata f. sp. avenae]|uniref:Reverse transcriptase Ty1/copia-type domain-containing protein n=1 Tax=Puccinia coronata f. sp. avenae TaxID=200324 RepID=A0A2N5UMG4_9BASI|nr:hypothetical protein PCASD_11715 [Puccinia coronata f. sp. avenae]
MVLSVISREYSPTTLKFPYNFPSAPSKTITSSNNGTTPLESPPSTPPPPPRDKPSAKLSPQRRTTPPPEIRPSLPRDTPVLTQPAAKKGYAYVPAHEPPKKQIRGDVGKENIVTTSRQPHSQKIQLPDTAEDVGHIYCVAYDGPDNELLLNETVPVKTAFNNPSKISNWQAAMQKEYDSLHANHTGTFVPPPGDDKVIGGVWILSKKKNEFGDLLWYKARWVVFGNHQEYMQHYFNTYASVARNELFKSMLSLAVTHLLLVFQFDVKTAFLYGKMDAPVYVAQVEGFEEPGREKWVWRLNKLLYSTKQAPRQWQKHLVATLGQIGFTSSPLDESLFYNADCSVMLHMHVEDGFLVSNDRAKVLRVLDDVQLHYKIKIKERPSQHLSYTLNWKEDGSVHVNQADFTQKILQDFCMDKSNPVRAPVPTDLHQIVASESPMFHQKTYQKALGMLNYLALHTRPDITFATNLLSQFTSKPTVAQWGAVKHLLCYLKGTENIGIQYY